MVLFTPTLAAIKARWPRSRITLVVRRAGVGQVVFGGPLVDQVIESPSCAGWSQRLGEVLKAFGKYDIVISPVPLYHTYTELLLNFGGARHRIGMTLPQHEPGLLESRRTCSVVFRDDQHEVENYFRLLEPLGISGDSLSDVRPQVVIDERAATDTDAWIRKASLDKDPIIALHVGSHPDQHGKCLPSESFARILAGIESSKRGRAVILSGPDDLSHVEQLLALIPHKVDVFRHAQIGHVASFLASCSAVIANDSGPMHLAAAVGTPVVGIFGPTSPIKNSPWAMKNRARVVRMNIGCSPCYVIGGSIQCSPRRCLEDLPASWVLDALDDLLGQNHEEDGPWGVASHAPRGGPVEAIGPPTRGVETRDQTN